MQEIQLKTQTVFTSLSNETRGQLKAVIIAAGDGSRLGAYTGNKPKCLIRIHGLSIIDRIILLARKSGLKEFIIVTGYEASVLKQELGDGNKHGVSIQYVHNGEWEKENGLSVYRARELVGDEFILLMSDHLFDPGTLKKLKKRFLQENECILAVDRDIKRVFDLEDATKVRCEGNTIMDVGKEIQDFNAIDTGMFRCNRTIFTALEECFKEGQYTLGAAVKRLAGKGLLRAIDVEGNFWHDIDTKADIKNVKKQYLENLNKRTDGPVSRWINRPLSTRLSGFLARYRITPNQISIVSFLLTVFAAIFFTITGHFWLFLAGCSAQLASIIDGCDGEIARLKFMDSQSGGYLDTVLDRFGDGLIITGMTVGLGWNMTGLLPWITGFFALNGTLLTSYTAIKNDELIKQQVSTGKTSLRWGRDSRMFMIFIGAITNQIFLVLVILALAGNIAAIERLIVIFRYESRMEQRLPGAWDEILQVISQSVIEEDYGHALSTVEVVKRLSSNPPDALLVAALSHDIERSLPGEKVKREDFADYDQFKEAHAANSAIIVKDILAKHDLPPAFINKVGDLIEAHEFGGNQDEDLLCTADTLSFFTHNLPYYLKRNGVAKTAELVKWKLNRITLPKRHGRMLNENDKGDGKRQIVTGQHVNYNR
ncbi:MAG: DUF4202 family protein [Candidatus Odinarchaeota archaeon]